MINIVIAAGYATRLGELTKNFPKPLLEIGKTTILGRMLDDIDRIPQITEHVIVTNHKFAHIFEEWAAKQTYTKPIRIIDDGTDTNENRLGAVCDLILAINSLPQGGGQEGASLPLPNLLRRMSMRSFPHAPTDAERYEQGDEEEYSWIKP